LPGQPQAPLIVTSLQQLSGCPGSVTVPLGRQQRPPTHCATPLQSPLPAHVLHFAKVPVQWPPVTDEAHEEHVPT
jgi:hypothetical protein